MMGDGLGGVNEGAQHHLRGERCSICALMKRRDRPRTSSGFTWACVCAIGVALALVALGPSLEAARAVVVLADLMGASKPFAGSDAFRSEVRENEELIAIPSGRVRARRYSPIGVRNAPGVVLLHGVHPRGIDEPRLRAFARSLAAGGVRVLTPELSELLAYRIDAITITKIGELATAHARSVDRASAGVIGISFAGGLALMAAARQAARAPIGFVVTVGSHDDLLRLCDYYAGKPVRGPNGEPADVAPHPYGARVMIREHLDRFFSADDLQIARRSLDSYLRDRHDLARRLATSLSDAGKPTMATLLSDAASPELSALLENAAAAVRDQLVAASPHGQLAGLQVPVFLVHGEADPIIPSIESRWLARQISAQWLRQLVITPLLRHAEFATPPSLAEQWELVRLMRGILQAAGST